MAAATDASAAAKGEDGSKRLQFPTRSFHGAVIALVLSLAVFRFFIQGETDLAALESRQKRRRVRRIRTRRSETGRMWGLQSSRRGESSAEGDCRGADKIAGQDHVPRRRVY